MKNPTPIMELEDCYNQHSFNLRNSKFKKLEKLAKKLGYEWNGKPSVGKMLNDIADSKLKLTK